MSIGSQTMVLPPEILDILREVLRCSWDSIRHNSEHLARTIGLDELRVDWLVGDSRWGPRIGKLTYLNAPCGAVTTATHF